MYTLNSYANARKEPREDNTTTSNTGNPAASVYTLRPVFCILSSELIQSRGPPGDFRCGEIVIAAADAASTSMATPPRFYKRSFLDYDGGGGGGKRERVFLATRWPWGKNHFKTEPSPPGIGIGIAAGEDVERGEGLESLRSNLNPILPVIGIVLCSFFEFFGKIWVNFFLIFFSFFLWKLNRLSYDSIWWLIPTRLTVKVVKVSIESVYIYIYFTQMEEWLELQIIFHFHKNIRDKFKYPRIVMESFSKTLSFVQLNTLR